MSKSRLAIFLFLFAFLFTACEPNTPNGRLRRFSARGNLEKVKAALAEGAEINSKNSNGETALICASKSNGDQSQILEFLIKKGADVHLRTYTGWNALMWSMAKKNNTIEDILRQNKAMITKEEELLVFAYRGDLEKIKLSAQKGIDLDYKDKSANTALLYAISQKQTETAKYLIDKGVDLKHFNLFGNNALLEAAIANQLEVTRILIDKGLDVNTRNRTLENITNNNYPIAFDGNDILVVGTVMEVSRSTPLIFAIKNKNIDLAKLLIEKGADVNLQDLIGLTPLMIATNEKDMDLINLLLESKADINAQMKESITTFYKIDKETDFYKEISKDVNPDIFFNEINGSTALHIAAMHKEPQIVKLLIANGADVNARNDQGWSPLLVSLLESKIETISLLIENGADLKVQNNWGHTPLLLAIRRGNQAAFDLLIQKGVDINARIFDQLVPIPDSEIESYADFHKVFEFNIEDRIAEFSGWTALMYTANKGALESVKLLVENGAKIKTKSNNGDTALLLAEKQGHKKTAAYLNKTLKEQAKKKWTYISLLLLGLAALLL